MISSDHLTGYGWVRFGSCDWQLFNDFTQRISRKLTNWTAFD